VSVPLKAVERKKILCDS